MSVSVSVGSLSVILALVVLGWQVKMYVVSVSVASLSVVLFSVVAMYMLVVS